MMAVSCVQFLENLAHAFDQDRLDVIAQHFAYPCPFYADNNITVFGGPSALIEGLQLYRTATVKAGIVRVVPRIVAQGVPVRGYSNVWVEWDHLTADRTCLRTNQVRYAVFQDSAALFPRIEMIDYTVIAFPEVQDQFPMFATA